MLLLFKISFLMALAFWIVFLNKSQYRLIALGVSSLPGIGYVTIFGFASVSTIAIVGINILAASVRTLCCPLLFLEVLLRVFNTMHRSGSLVSALKILEEFVNIPSRQYLVWANSPHSFAQFSTVKQLRGDWHKNKITPPLK